MYLKVGSTGTKYSEYIKIKQLKMNFASPKVIVDIGKKSFYPKLQNLKTCCSMKLVSIVVLKVKTNQ